MKTVNNSRDDLAVQRIINVPKRGIGQTSISRAMDFAIFNDLDLFEALEHTDRIPNLGRATAKIQPFVDLIHELREISANEGVLALINAVIEKTGYVEELKAEKTEEADARIENINELISKVVDYEQNADEPTLNGFLEDVGLFLFCN